MFVATQVNKIHSKCAFVNFDKDYFKSDRFHYYVSNICHFNIHSGQPPDNLNKITYYTLTVLREHIFWYYLL